MNVVRHKEDYFDRTPTERQRVCCNCKHHVSASCDVDGHYVGYIQCFENWCRQWASDEAMWKGESHE